MQQFFDRDAVELRERQRFDVLGSDVPFSHLLTACALTPTRSASCSCVRLRRLR